MKVLTVYANPNPRSFCHAILEKFSQGLEDTGHRNEVEHVYFYSVGAVDAASRQSYLQQAYCLGKEFA